MNTGERPISYSFESLPSLMRETYVLFEKYAEGKNILDVGCGEGYVTAYLSKAAKHATGIDVDGKVIKMAKKRFLNIKNLSFYKMSGDNLDFLPHSFDVVVSAQSIEHIKNDNKFLENVKRVLKSNGVFICVTPNKLSIVPDGEKLYDKPFYPFHHREYTPEQFFDLLNRYFKDVERKCFCGIKRNPEMRKNRRFKFIYRMSRFSIVRWAGRHLSADIKKIIWFFGQRHLDIGDAGWTYNDYEDEVIPENLAGICRTPF